MCGICWGHQTIALVFGGEVVDMAMPELGVTEVTLTAAGERFFKPQQEALTTCATSPPTTLRVQQHHRREVSVAPPEFVHLAADNQIFLSPNNNILTIQSHPEKDAQTAKLRIGDVRRWFPEGVGTEDEVIKRMELPHDGLAIWERILRWALEEG
ncbi:hypothetical protein VTK73DRAFT_7043 [Phialemonium thermophilum]|uniref:Glutamine amidotransferase domain-containing protein n=1 Tax=Phialemonium thermophilum TaxID=223376 RepID=A0ABR3WH03_9PEZI